MTTYQYTIRLNDSEYLYLERLFKLGIEEFKKQHPEMPNHKSMAEELLDKLKASCSSAEMMSASSYCRDNN